MSLHVAMIVHYIPFVSLVVSAISTSYCGASPAKYSGNVDRNILSIRLVAPGADQSPSLTPRRPKRNTQRARKLAQQARDKLCVVFHGKVKCGKDMICEGVPLRCKVVALGGCRTTEE